MTDAITVESCFFFCAFLEAFSGQKWMYGSEAVRLWGFGDVVYVSDDQKGVDDRAMATSIL